MPHKTTEGRRAYNRRPDVRRRLKAYRATPAQREHIKEYKRAVYQLESDHILAKQRSYRKKNKAHVLRLEHLQREKNPIAYMLAAARARAKRLRVPFSLNPTDVSIPALCPVFGTPIYRIAGTRTGNSPALDRVIPTRGYVSTNVCVISYRANVIKNNGSSEEHRQIADYIDRHSEKKG